ncbi:MAG TPA: hypothetical protein VGL72_16185 [Bryobacteraceae bacterium]
MTHRFKVTAMKYPGFYANSEVEADSLDQAVAVAKGLDWSNQNFEPTQDWPPVQSLLVESEENSRIVDLEASPTTAIAVLREFVDDVKLAYGTGEGDAIDKTALDWPDLAATYYKAAAVLEVSIAHQTVFVATYEHKHGTDIRVFRTRAQAEAWRTEVASTWWEDEFPDVERPAEAEIGEVYFDRMRDHGEEFFSIDANPVE